MATLFRLFGFLCTQRIFKLICFSIILTWSVPDASYSRNASCALNFISTFILDLLTSPCYIYLTQITEVNNTLFERKRYHLKP